jgi:pimeloyl-ACP methyl ester carboxylesterase
MPTSPQKKHTVKVGRVPGSGDPMEVDPRWLLKWLAVVFGAALFCGYLTLCGLFYQGQWQFVLHPAAGNGDTPAKLGLPFDDVRFDYTETGQPQLHGWWIPADKSARYAQQTILYLHGGDGSLADTLLRLKELHDAGLNVFAFDYRGFGASEGPHPDEVRMWEDSAAAWDYLMQKRNIPAAQIIPYGEGVGGSLATQLAAEHTNIPAVILNDPHFDLVSQVKQDPRAELIPVRLLFHERFKVTTTTQAPKLLLLDDGLHLASAADISAIIDPKLVVHLGTSATDVQRSQSLSRFLDEYLPAPAVQSQ